METILTVVETCHRQSRNLVDRGHAHDTGAARDGCPVRSGVGIDRRGARPDPAGGRDDRRDHHRGDRLPAHDRGRGRGRGLLRDLPAG